MPNQHRFDLYVGRLLLGTEQIVEVLRSDTGNRGEVIEAFGCLVLPLMYRHALSGSESPIRDASHARSDVMSKPLHLLSVTTENAYIKRHRSGQESSVRLKLGLLPPDLRGLQAEARRASNRANQLLQSDHAPAQITVRAFSSYDPQEVNRVQEIVSLFMPAEYALSDPLVCGAPKPE